MNKEEMPLDTSAYLADTGHLSTFEHGAYMLLLMAMWRTPDGWLPNDDKTLARVTKTTGDKWKRIAPTMRVFLLVEGDRISQKKLLKNKSRSKSQNPSQDSSIDRKPLKSLDSESNAAPEAANAPTTTPFLFVDSEGKEEKKESVVTRSREPRRAPRQPLPKDWKPSEHGTLYAKSKGFDDQKIIEMGRGCLLYYRRRGDLIADCEAVWEAWVDREIKFAASRPDRGGTGRNGKVTFADIARGTDGH